MKVEFDFSPRNLCTTPREAKEPNARTPDEPASPVKSLALQLALGYHINSLIAAGAYEDIAGVATAAKISRARVSQILDLTLLSPTIQESVLDGSFTLGSHALRRLAGMLDWEEQKRWLEITQ